MISLKKYFDVVLVMSLDKRDFMFDEVKHALTPYHDDIRKLRMGAGRLFPKNSYFYIDFEQYGQEINYQVAIHGTAIMADNNNWKSYLIIEDDMQLLDNFAEVLENFDKQFEKHGLVDKWDMLYLSSYRDLAEVEIIDENVLRLKYNATGFFSVGINHTIYDVVEALKISPNVGVDGLYALAIQPYIKCYGVYPSVTRQRPCHSFRENIFLDRENAFINTIGKTIIDKREIH